MAGTYLTTDLPGVELLGERAALAGLRRRAPFSPGGAFRCVPARDGWLGLSLARDQDRDLLPALVESTAPDDPWDAVATWARTVDVAAAHSRAVELQYAVAAVPRRRPGARRRPVEVVPGGPRRPRRAPLVVDLTSLWAGPLAARLLGLGGAEVIKIESRTRPDGARAGCWPFFQRLHEGHEMRELDLRTDLAQLQDLVAAADVVLEASRPRAQQRLGIDAQEHVRRGGVWASITAYGRSGPMSERIGFGDDVAVEAGLHSWQDGWPITVGDALADPLAEVHTAAAAAVALAGERGCLLDVSMHDVALRAASTSSGRR